MPRVIAIDYGGKRTGLAWTDPLQIIATGLGTVDTDQLKKKLEELLASEDITSIVLGYPTKMDGSDTNITAEVRDFAEWIRKSFSHIHLELWDERFTSKMAMDAMIQSGVKRKKRRDKNLINEVSATILLQEWLLANGN